MAETSGNPQGATSICESFAKGGWEGYLRYMTTGNDRQGRVTFYELATRFTALGERDKAIEALNNSYNNREINLPDVKTDPLLDPLRNDPGFDELIRKIGFPE